MNIYNGLGLSKSSLVVKLVVKLSKFAKSSIALLTESLGCTYIMLIVILECPNTLEIVSIP